MKIEVQETRDWRLVWQISQHPEIFDRVTNDSWAALDIEVRAAHVQLIVENPANHTFVVTLDGKTAGCFILDAKGNGRFELHTLLMPECHGKAGLEAARKALEMVEQYQDVRCIESYCPTNHREILLFAILCGFKKMGVELGKWIKNGMVFDLVKVERMMPCH